MSNTIIINQNKSGSDAGLINKFKTMFEVIETYTNNGKGYFYQVHSESEAERFTVIFTGNDLLKCRIRAFAHSALLNSYGGHSCVEMMVISQNGLIARMDITNTVTDKDYQNDDDIMHQDYKDEIDIYNELGIELI